MDKKIEEKLIDSLEDKWCYEYDGLIRLRNVAVGPFEDWLLKVVEQIERQKEIAVKREISEKYNLSKKNN